MNFVRRRTALLLAAAAALPVLATALAQARFSRDLLAASADAQVAARLERIAARMEGLDQRYRAKVRAKATWIARVPSLRTEEALLVSEKDDPNVSSISVLDLSGRVIASSDHARTGEPGVRHSLAGFFETGAAEPWVEAGTVHYLAPSFSAGLMEGAVLLEVPLEKFKELMEPAASHGVTTLLRNEGGDVLSRAPAEQSGASEETMPEVSRPVTGTHWTVVATSYLHTPPASVAHALRDSMLACCAAVALAFVAQMLTIRRALLPIRRMTRVAADLAEGDYTARLPVDGDTELAPLAEAFNEMAGRLAVAHADLEDKVRERTQALEAVNLEMSHRNSELAERSDELAKHRYREQAKGRALAALTADDELNDVVGAALGELAAPVGAAVMICYKLEGTELVPIASYAASEAARTTPIPLAGMSDYVLGTGRIEILQNIPDELELRFDCLVAAGRPRALVLVPLRVGNRPSGLLMAGSLSSLPAEAATILADVAAPLALTIARRTLLDHTERIARELARRNDELAEQASALEMQGEALRAQKQELSIKNEEVQKADRLKTEFLANMSHELRTPLNAVIGFSELLLDDGEPLGPVRRQWVHDIQASGRHLLMLINRVLDLAKIEAGHMAVSLEPISPAEAVAASSTLVRPGAQKKDISISLVENETGPVRADRLRLQQVLLNLLSNAVKFSPAGSSIELGYEPVEGAVRFWVMDRGPGIDAETQKRLFEPFFQAESPLVKKHEGTGLGLAISRRLIEQQGGTIGVASQPGRGSTFFFTLPLAGEIDSAPLPDVAPPAPPPSASAFSATVLVVDDHDLNRHLARAMLQRRGCKVLLASDGEEGLAAARQELPQLILLDLAMPGKDGFAVAAELKRDARTGRIPVVALTAMAMPGDSDRVRAAGFDGYLPKPLEREALDAILGQFLSESGVEARAGT